MTYNEAYKELEKIVAEIEDDGIELDLLSEKIKKAKELLLYCEERLRKIETKGS